MLGGSTVDRLFARTTEDEAIEEEEYHRAHNRQRQRLHNTSRSETTEVDDYVERSRRFKQEQAERVPYLRGPKEDDNPIIDYIIKKRKLESSGERTRERMVNTLALQTAIRDAQIHNRLEDERQLEGARSNLRELMPDRAHEQEVRLLTASLNGSEQPRASEPPAAPAPHATGTHRSARNSAPKVDMRLLNASLEQAHAHNSQQAERREGARALGISALASMLRTGTAAPLTAACDACDVVDGEEEGAAPGAAPAPSSPLRPRKVDTRLLAASLSSNVEHNRKEDARQLDGARANLRAMGLPDEDAVLLTALLNNPTSSPTH